MKFKVLFTHILAIGIFYNLNANPWDSVSVILSRIHEPVFPDTTFDVTIYGAIGDSSTLCTNAFQKAIDSCSAAGGGKVIVQDGVYLTGPIILKSNVNFYINKDAKIIFSSDTLLYKPLVYTRFQGIEYMGYRPLIYAFEEENIAITGEGILDGQGANWDSWVTQSSSDFQTLEQWADNDIPVNERIFQSGCKLRPSMIQPYRCKNVFIDSIHVREGPFWHLHPVLCRNVKISNVSVIGHWHNNDGCNPESCKDVLIRNCYFDTGDDCIAIKSGRNTDGRRINVSSEKILIQNCTMKDGHGGVVIGSESTGGANYIFAEDCFMNSPNLWYILRIKTNSYRGSHVNHIYVRNIDAQTVGYNALRINYYYGEGSGGEYQPDVNNIYLENVNISTNVGTPIDINCYQNNPARDIYFKNCHFLASSITSRLNNVQYLYTDSSGVNNRPLLYIAHDEETLQAESYTSADKYSFSNYGLTGTGYGYMESMGDSSSIVWQTDSAIFKGSKVKLLYRNTNVDSLNFNFMINHVNSNELQFAPSISYRWDTLIVSLNDTVDIYNLQLSAKSTGTGFFLDKIVIENPLITSANSVHDKGEILVYPNPARDIINVRGQFDDCQYKICIYSIIGQHIVTMQGVVSNNQQIAFNINSLKPGVYILSIQENNGEKTNRIFNKF
ncbi:MAG: T9SS type A sorting domain-containing protein [Bacteroidales bacterium]|nr:T9SS type A sorting domain-containing protein [Bacteroidales bacterium]